MSRGHMRPRRGVLLGNRIPDRWMMAKKLDKTDLPAALASAIRASQLTSYALAKSAGLHPITIDRFLRGERDLTLTTAGKLASALGLVLTRPPDPA